MVGDIIFSCKTCAARDYFAVVGKDILQHVVFVNETADVVGCIALGGFAEFDAGGIVGIVQVLQAVV